MTEPEKEQLAKLVGGLLLNVVSHRSDPDIRPSSFQDIINFVNDLERKAKQSL